MTGPAIYVSVSALASKINSYKLSKSIDDPSNLAGDHVYVFSGKYDKIAYPGVVKLNKELYSQFDAIVKTNFDMAAHHGFPTDNFGAACSTLNLANYINNCNFNLAYDMLNHLYGGNLIKPPSNSKTALIGQMVMFDQDKFIDFGSAIDDDGEIQVSIPEWIQRSMFLYTAEDWEWSASGLFNLTMSNAAESSEMKSITTRSSLSSLDDQGFIYFPSACANGKKCSIHVAFHGCQQGKTVAGDVFATKAGYLEVAELNDIIMIFPQLRRSVMLPANPMGCWDWWGYTSSSYATKRGLQMSAVKKMIDTVRVINKAFARAN